MLREIGLFFLLSGCSTTIPAGEGAPITDLCEVERKSDSDEVRLLAVVETDGLHGMFLSSEKCRFALRIGKSSGAADKSVERFMSHVSKSSSMAWRRYDGEFSGRIILEDSSRIRFELLHVFWFRDSGPEQK